MNRLKAYLGKATSHGRQVLGSAVQPFKVIPSTADAYAWKGTPGGGDIDELVIVADSANVGYVRLAIDAVVGATNYMQLNPGDSIGVEGLTLDQLHMLFEKNADKAYLMYTQVAS